MIKKILLLLMFLPVYLLAWKMESGTVTLPSTVGGGVGWTTVTLRQTYTDPVVIAMPTEEDGYPGSVPVALRIKDVTSTDFKIVQLAGTASTDTNSQHPEMNVSYFVIEKGQHTLNGITIEAGEVSTSKVQHGTGVSGVEGYDRILFNSTFTATPIVLAMIQGVENQPSLDPAVLSSPWLTTAIDNVNNTRFDIALERAEVNRGVVSIDEQVGYIAMDAGIQNKFFDTETCQAVDFETILTPNQSITGWDDRCSSFNYANSYSTNPKVIGTQNDHRGGDGGWLRRCSQDTTSIGLTIDEDIYRDNRSHGAAERAGLLIFSNDFVYDSTFDTLACGVVAEYRMDECYWLDNANGVIHDVKDSSENALHGTSYNDAQIDTNTNNAIVGFSGTFDGTGDHVDVDDNILFDFSAGNKFSVSFWLHIVNGNNTKGLIGKSNNNVSSGWAFDIDNQERVTFRIGDGNTNSLERSDSLSDGWHHIVGVYDLSLDRAVVLYIDGTRDGDDDAGALVNSTNLLYMARTSNETNTYNGQMDEVKIFNRALTNTEISDIFTRESNGKNWDDNTDRNETVCEATVNSNSWELVGIPIDLRTDPKTVAETFQGMTGTYGTDWRVFRRDYSDTNNSSWYTYLDDPDNNMTEFGKGYWLGNALGTEETWNVDGTQAVEYDSTHPDCPANQCVEIDVKSVSLDFTTDTNDGTGPYRYNLTGFVGKSPVSWADCRFIIDGTAYTPTAAESAGYVSKVIWQYNPGNSGTDANGYTSCDDTTPGTCLLEPYKGFWVELREITKDKTVKLLIPQE